MKKVLKSLETMRNYATYDNGMDLTVNTKLRDEFIITVNNIKKELSKLDKIREMANSDNPMSYRLALIKEILGK